MMSGVGAGSYSLVIPNQLTALRQMTAWLEQCIQAMGLPDEVLFNFDLCANEAVANVISYAFPQPGEHQITLRLVGDGGRLSLEIEDDGVAFNPLERPAHLQPASLEEASIGGLGIDLMRSFMSECHYRREQGRNILRLVAEISQ